MYDWANSAFALSIMAVLFPLFLGSYWSSGASGTTVTARLAWATSAANFVVIVLAPVLGTIADAGGFRKRFLVTLAFLGAVMTTALGLVSEGNWWWALGFYMLASVGFYSSTVFYDSLLVDVTRPKYFDFVSALGFAMGYLGGASLLAIHVWMLTSPERFGLDSVTGAMKVAFVSVGAWWALFLLPLIKWVPESRHGVEVPRGVIRAAYRKLRSTFIHIGQYREALLFLVAYWLYIGGVFTVISMAANFGQRLGFDQTDLVVAFMVTNLAGFPATILYGLLGHRLGARVGLLLAIAVYIVVCVFAGFVTSIGQFYILAIVIGCVQGGVQGLSRSFFASLIPNDAPGEFFGFYGFVTKLSHVVGPALVGLGTLISDNPRFILLALLPLFVLGAGLLVRIPAPER